MRNEKKDFKAGFVALIGRPNVGKSTLLNQLVGEKITITSPLPQTTRNIIRGIITFEEAQVIFLDTPGIVELSQVKTVIDKELIKETLKNLEGVDIIAFIVNSSPPTANDRFILKDLKKIKKPSFLLINKIDKIKEAELNSIKEDYESFFSFTKIIPISAKKGTNLSILMGEIINHLPFHSPYYSSDFITDQPERLLVAELIREKIFNFTKQEIPYSVMVKVDEFEERRKGLIYLHATIFTEHSSQKGILVGKSGKMIKKIGEAARSEIEKRLGCQVYLDLWISVKRNWRHHKDSLKEIEYK
ncbi:GTPase Era [Candidatus Aerophobetes bacterium]|nr:GTPase Era [Candidatus Aerophobetes bacterium]